MKISTRNSAVLLVSVSLLIVVASALIWRGTTWHKAGWTGLTYFGVPTPQEKEAEKFMNFGMFIRHPREAFMVIPTLPASRAGLRHGDKIVSINDVKVEDIKGLRALNDGLKRGDEVRYVFERGGQTLGGTATLVSPFTYSKLIFSMVGSSFCGLVFILISQLVYWTKPRSRPSLIFFFMCVVGAGFFFCSALTELEMSNLRGIIPADKEVRATFVFFIYGLLAVVMSQLLLHLSLVFPFERPVVRKFPGIFRLLHTVHFLPLISLVGFITGASASGRGSPNFILSGFCLLLLGLIFWNIARERGRSWQDRLMARPIILQVAVVVLACSLSPLLRMWSRETAIAFGIVTALICMLLFAMIVPFYSVLTIVALYRSYRESGVEEKRQVRWPLWGTIVGLGSGTVISVAYLILANLYPLQIARNSGLGTVVSLIVRLTYVLIPVSFAFGIVKYRLMDIDLIIRKTVIYATVTAFVVMMYFVLVAGLGTFLVRVAGVHNQTTTIIATLALAALFIPARNRVQKFVDRRIFRSRYDYAEALSRIDQALLEITAIEPFLKMVAELMQQALQSRSVLILAQGGNSDRLTPVGRVGVPDEAAADVSFPVNLPAFKDARGLTDVKDLALSEAHRGLLRRIYAASIFAIRHKSALLGVIVVGRSLSRAEWDEEDRQFITAVGDRISRWFSASRAGFEEVEYDQAREFQQTLLPRNVPQMDGVGLAAMWQPARTVGGDYFDLIRFSDSLIGICIGDVAGKGMPAALLMSTLQASVKAIATAETPPREVCEKVRRVVCSSLAGGKFVTFFYALIDTSKRTITSCNAGHNPPIKVDSKGDVARLAVGGPVFARLLAQAGYEEESLHYQSGDKLLLFTDGISEARSPGDEDFGEDRLTDILLNNLDKSADEIRAAVLDSVQAFTSGILHDDVTMVCVDFR